MTWYKFLSAGATGPFSHFHWPAPQDGDTPGGWVVAQGPLDPCRSGLHLCRPADLPFWMLEELYAVEVDGSVLHYDDFVLAGRARLLRRVETWGRAHASSFSSQCVGRVRDLAVEALRDDLRDEAADRLVGREAPEDLLQEARRLLDAEDAAAAFIGYLLDAARFAVSAQSEPRWAAHAATVGLVSATAARAAAADGERTAAVAAERARQAEWLAGHLVAAV